MPSRLFAAILLATALGAVSAQDAPPAQPQGPGGWQGQRGGRGGMMGMGRGTVGTVTEVSADHYTLKTELGEVYTVHYSVNTRILKQPPGQPRRGQGDEGERTPPTAIKPTEIKVGDVIAASGEVDANAKSVGAVVVMLIDPERAKEMRAMEANFGKTWLMGRVTAINGLKVTLQGGPGNASHTFVADENTTFRKRRDPITLGDIQMGDMVRVEGAVKDGTFLATTVAVMGPQPTGGPNHGDHVEGQPPPQ
ncbi:MAG: DUF5666 domain-containing protein [Terracidiphilus sp.]